ncbi:MAG: hypothetical protein JWM95_1187 [Gemmatimonadetes bacterium]|nr:hypothetical protein [Gemmatimonadota bacterium]
MKLAIFDVDGTLLNNLASEDACFAKAVSEVLRLPELNTDWATYGHVTDGGIATEAYRRVYSTDPAPALLDAVIARFVELLAITHRTEHITEVAGASNLLLALPSLGWSVAIATGAWQRAASFKLTAGALPWEQLPIATAEDGPARTDIVQRARAQAETLYNVSSFEKVVSIGDAVWDVTTARALGLPFVGVGRGVRANRLRMAGASIVLADFADVETVLLALEQAVIPRTAGAHASSDDQRYAI